MITNRELVDIPLPGRIPRNLRKRFIPVMGRNGVNNSRYSSMRELTVEDSPDRTMNFSGFGEGETMATAPAVAAEGSAPPAAPATNWGKWLVLAGLAGVALYLIKTKGK